MACLNHWIPAFAGMTAGVDSGLCLEQADSSQALTCLLCCSARLEQKAGDGQSDGGDAHHETYHPFGLGVQ